MRRAFALATGLVILATCLAVKADDEKSPKRSAAEVKAIAKIKELGGQVMELAQNDPQLRSLLSPQRQQGDRRATQAARSI